MRRKTEYVKITCQMCGKEFRDVPSNNDRKFCSWECKSMAQRKRIKCVCIVCGRYFEVFERYNNSNGAKFCSQKCRSSQKIEKICKQCSKSFMVKPSQSSQIFCSRKCQVSSGDRKRKRICRYCGSEFVANFPSSQSKYCSAACSKSYRKIKSICKKCGKLFLHRRSDNKVYCSLKCSNSAEHKVSVLVSNTIKRIKNGECVSKTELLLKNELELNGFVSQYISDFGSIDYANTNKKIAVFVDGVFWHGREGNHWRNTSFVNKIIKNKKRDIWQNKELKAYGWVVLRYWDDYVRANTDECLSDIFKVVHNR